MIVRCPRGGFRAPPPPRPDPLAVKIDWCLWNALQSPFLYPGKMRWQCHRMWLEMRAFTDSHDTYVDIQLFIWVRRWNVFQYFLLGAARWKRKRRWISRHIISPWMSVHVFANDSESKAPGLSRCHPLQDLLTWLFVFFFFFFSPPSGVEGWRETETGSSGKRVIVQLVLSARTTFTFKRWHICMWQLHSKPLNTST